MPSDQTTPGRVDHRRVLPPVRGGLVSLQATKALAQGPQNTFGGISAAMPDLPSRLPPIRTNLFGPTNMPDKPTHLQPIQGFPDGKGKGPANGNFLPKKGTPQSSQEDIDKEESDMPKPKSFLPHQSIPGAKQFPPPFQTTRPLPPLGGRGKPLPHIGGRLSSFPSLSPAASMPPRRVAPDPFGTGPTNAIRSPLRSPTSVSTPFSPGRVTPVPLSSIRSPPSRPTVSPSQSPTKVLRSPPIPTSPSREAAATEQPTPADTVTSTSGGGEGQT